MADRFMHTVLTPSVLQAERQYYGRSHSVYLQEPERDAFTPGEVEFISQRDSFYMATVTETGWPYIQHRGGPKGFLHVTGCHELTFADYGGNRQMISVGGLAANDRINLFLMSYPTRERLKILGHAKVLDAREHPALLARIAPNSGTTKIERIFVIDVLSYDWNCPKFITPRYSAADIETALAPLQARIAELEAQLQHQHP